jgi:hypothetical protein
MSLLGERQQKFKLVDQDAKPSANRLTECHEYHARRRTHMPKKLSERVLVDRHCIFVSPHFTNLLIVFPYRSMRQLY